MPILTRVYEGREMTYYEKVSADADLVEEGFGCPQCHECRSDDLIWDEWGDTLTCDVCGHVYRLEMVDNCG